MANAVVWFDIPVLDIDRATQFYSAVLGKPLERHDWEGMPVAVLPHENDDVSGCLFQKQGETPTANGPLLYLNVGGRLDAAITAAENNGGKILTPKHALGPYGFRAIVLDSEGNRIALHSS